MTRRWLFPFLLLVLLLGSFWLLEQLKESSGDQEGNLRREEPDYSIDNFTTISMGKTGLPRYRLKAKRMVHYPIDDVSDLEEPYLIFFDEKSHAIESIESREVAIEQEKLPSMHSAWHIESERGKILDKGRFIFLQGKVHLWKNDDSGIMELDIRTRDLRLFPEANYGETDETITIQTATTVTRGTGMRTHLKPDRLELLSRVETIYQQAQNQ
uniref:Lipopolysaccharide export system protein LptC n=1 Tax=Candidatus Kentrum sp. MB TaxID=2138164 RepID=A0A450WZS2_9GAMM|nr:MAG: LPS export ABC transporter protein LptC [Candidatus Kentron sp. MB]